MADDTLDEQPDAPPLSVIATAIVESVLSLENLQKLERTVGKAGREAASDTVKALWKTIRPVFLEVLKALLGVLEGAEPAVDDIAKLAVDALLGEGPRRGHLPDDVGKKILEKLAPPGGAVEPGIEGAAHYLTTVTHLQFETWLLGFTAEMFEFAADWVRGAGGTIHSVAELREIAAQVMGGGRITRRVLAPFIDAGIVTPAKWATNKQYRPMLLAESAALEAFFAGRLTRDALEEELARQGWSSDRIGQQVENARKRLSVADVEVLQWRTLRSLDWAKTYLHDLGYDVDTLEDLLLVQGTKHIEQLESAETSALVTAYADRAIDDTTFQSLLTTAVTVPAERAFATELATLRRTLNVRHLSASQVAALVMDDILAFVDYRAALAREGYQTEDIAALELQLRKRKNEARDVADLKKDQAAQREADKQRTADERAARLAETAVAKAQPALVDVRRAYVRGHVPIERFVEAVRFAHDGITDADLAALVDEALQDRDDYLAAVERRKAADAANLDQAVPLAKIEDAVMHGILTLDDYARELAQRHYDADESWALVMLLRTKVEDQAQATKAREAAAQRAALKGISLPDFERAVRLGVRTIEQYAALLDQLATPEVGKALALDLLRAQLRQDAEGLAKRQAAEAAAKVKNISLEQRRRAVVRGVRPRSYYERALVDAGLPVDDQQVELSLLDLELAEAKAAQERRAQVAREITDRQAREEASRQARAATAAEPPAPPTLTLGQVERAVTLRLLAPDDLRDYLYAQGYTDTDVELLVALVVADVPDTRAGQQRRAAVTTELRAKGVSLTDYERSVRRGLRTVDAYAALLTSQGYGDDDVLLLRTLLEEEVAIDLDGLRVKIRKLLEAAPDLPTLDELEAALASGELAAAQAQSFLTAIGVPRDTALVYVRLLITSPDGV